MSLCTCAHAHFYCTDWTNCCQGIGRRTESVPQPHHLPSPLGSALPQVWTAGKLSDAVCSDKLVVGELEGMQDWQAAYEWRAEGQKVRHTTWSHNMQPLPPPLLLHTLPTVALTEVLQYRDHVVAEVESVQFLQWL